MDEINLGDVLKVVHSYAHTLLFSWKGFAAIGATNIRKNWPQYIVVIELVKVDERIKQRTIL